MRALKRAPTPLGYEAWFPLWVSKMCVHDLDSVVCLSVAARSATRSGAIWELL